MESNTNEILLKLIVLLKNTNTSDQDCYHGEHYHNTFDDEDRKELDKLHNELLAVMEKMEKDE